MNAKIELIDIIKSTDIKCAEITIGYFSDDCPVIILKENYTNEELEEFLTKLDFDYDDGCGGQELYGIVWHKNNKDWLTRGEYNGSEWWNYNSLPEIPEQLQ